MAYLRSHFLIALGPKSADSFGGLQNPSVGMPTPREVGKCPGHKGILSVTFLTCGYLVSNNSHDPLLL